MWSISVSSKFSVRCIHSAAFTTNIWGTLIFTICALPLVSSLAVLYKTFVFRCTRWLTRNTCHIFWGLHCLSCILSFVPIQHYTCQVIRITVITFLCETNILYLGKAIPTILIVDFPMSSWCPCSMVVDHLIKSKLFLTSMARILVTNLFWW